MRVLLVNTTELNGGAAIAANRLMHALNDHGIKAKMLVSKKSTNNLSVVGLHSFLLHKFHFLWERLGIYISNRFSKNNLFAVDTASAGTDITQMREFKEADVIHLHWVNQGFISLGDIRKIIKSGKPVVWTLHDMWEFTGICHYVNSCESYQSECCNCPLLTRPGKHDLANRIFKKKEKILGNADVRYVAVSSWLADCARKSTLLKTRSVQVIPNVLPVSRYSHKDKILSRQHFSLPTDKKILVFGAVKLDDPRKGLRYLNQALEQMMANNAYSKEELLLVLFGGVKNRAVLNEIPVEYRCLGFLQNDEELSMLYSAADVAVIPSTYETFGQTVIEAQACGCTPVTFTGSGQMDIIDHKVNGYLAEYLSVDDFAKGIQWALQTPADIQQLRNGVKKKYSEGVVAQQYIELYEQLVN